jgi:Holliday junction resolvase RusA-like endonuclease
MTPLLSIRLNGEPVPYRYTLVRIGGKDSKRSVIADDKGYAEWKRDAIGRMSKWRIEQRFERVQVPVVCEVASWRARPAKLQTFISIDGLPVHLPPAWVGSLGRIPWPVVGDTTNFGKAAEDAVVQASLLLDDRLCLETHSRKGYAAVGEQPCVEVKLWSAVEWYNMLG